MSNSKTPTKRRAWPAKRREKQAENCRKTAPSAHATGPKTAAGKAAASQNALKHGYYRAENLKRMEKLRALLREHRAHLQSIPEYYTPLPPPGLPRQKDSL